MTTIDISNTKIQCAIEIDVCDLEARQNIYHAFSMKFDDVRVHPFEWHEIPGNLFCLTFTATIVQSNTLNALIVAHCMERRTQMFELCGNCVGYTSTDGDGDFYRLFEHRNKFNQLRQFEKDHIKTALVHMDVYYPLPYLDGSHPECPIHQTHLEMLK